MDWEREVEITKVDDEQQIAFGWLSVAVTKDGEQVIDSDDDIIEPEELEKAAYNYVLYARQAGDMHKRVGVGRLVESMVFTKEKQELLGIPEGILPVGWFIGYKVDDLDTWAKIKDGTYSAFSIHGTGKREEVT